MKNTKHSKFNIRQELQLTNENTINPIENNNLIEMKHLQNLLILKETEIVYLKQDNETKTKRLISLEAQVSELRLSTINTFKNEREIKNLKETVSTLEKENKQYQDDMIDLRLKCEDETRIQTAKHEIEIHRIGATLELYQQNKEIINQLLLDKKSMQEVIDKLEQKNITLAKEYQLGLQRKEIANQNKFVYLKKKMMTNINQSQEKVTELNIQFMDESSKLTILQNQQLVIELEYRMQEIEQLNQRKAVLEKKVFELSKDIEIHKEVEIALAEKNKKIQQENKEKKNQYNNKKIDIPIDVNNYVDTSLIIKKTNNNQTVNSEISQHNNSIKNDYNNISNLEKKVIRLEKKLLNKVNDFKGLKNQYELIETKIKNYEMKYSNLFTLFENALKKFVEDEDLKTNKVIYLNVESLKKCDFEKFNKAEKYSILVILMKYILPLTNFTEGSVTKTYNNTNTKSNHKSHSTTNINSNIFSIKEKHLNKYIDDSELKTIFNNVQNQKRRRIKNRSYESLPLLGNNTNKK